VGTFRFRKSAQISEPDMDKSLVVDVYVKTPKIQTPKVITAQVAKLRVI
jgi:hypothetical protein